MKMLSYEPTQCAICGYLIEEDNPNCRPKEESNKNHPKSG